MSNERQPEQPKQARWDIAALALGFAGGVLGSLAVLSVWELPESMKEHALLSGPFLAFVALIVLLAMFHRPLREVLARGNLTLSWGDKKISIQEIEENFDREIESRLDSLASELEDLREQIPSNLDRTEEVRSEDRDGIAPFRTGALHRISEAFQIDSEDLASIIYHLGTSKYKWRNQDTLARRTGLSASVIEDLVRQTPQLIVRGTGRFGNVIFRLTESAKRDFGAIIAPDI